MNGNYLIPANTKSGELIFNIFTWTDLIMFSVGILLTVILLLVRPTDTLAQVAVSLSPALILSFLIIPVPNHHNMMTVIYSMILYLTTRQKFIWKGWSIYDEDVPKGQK